MKILSLILSVSKPSPNLLLFDFFSMIDCGELYATLGEQASKLEKLNHTLANLKMPVQKGDEPATLKQSNDNADVNDDLQTNSFSKLDLSKSANI